jgi:hypothetical protein
MEIYTILLITSDKSGSVLAMLQSTHSHQIPRIIIAGCPNALKDAWELQQNGLYFYNRVCTFLPHDKELIDAKKYLGIEDGFFNNKKQKESSNVCSNCGEPLTLEEICSKIMHIEKNDGSLNSLKGKAFCEKCKQKNQNTTPIIGDW